MSTFLVRGCLFFLGFFGLGLVAAELSVSFSDFDKYQGVHSRGYFETRLRELLLKDPALADYFQLGEKEFSLYASKEDKSADRAEYRIVYGSKPLENSGADGRDRAKPLSGVRVAIDPGHFGGPLARLEERYIDMKKPEGVQFDEGTLTLATARLLEQKLRHGGAEVLVTKTKVGAGAFPQDFANWRKSPAFNEAVTAKVASIADAEKKAAAIKWWNEEAAESVVFRLLYNNLDVNARAEKINAFNPDLTFCIHYNAAGGNEKETGKNLGSEDNYSMVFVPGSFMSGELSDVRSRYEFMRLLVSPDLDRSVEVAETVARLASANTGVPLASGSEKSAPYLAKSCLPTCAPGVFARNLAMTRLVRGPVVYGETLCQDNFQECELLAKRNLQVGDVTVSSRIEAVVDAYYEAAVKYFSK